MRRVSVSGIAFDRTSLCRSIQLGGQWSDLNEYGSFDNSVAYQNLNREISRQGLEKKSSKQSVSAALRFLPLLLLHNEQTCKAATKQCELCNISKVSKLPLFKCLRISKQSHAIARVGERSSIKKCSLKSPTCMCPRHKIFSCSAVPHNLCSNQMFVERSVLLSLSLLKVLD